MDKIVLCTCRNDSAFGRLSGFPQTLTRVLPLDATGYFRPQTHTCVPTPRKYKIQWGWHGDGVEDEQLLRQSSSDIVAVFGDIVAGVDGALLTRRCRDQPRCTIAGSGS